MFEILCGLLSDKKGGIIFRCFGVWHICFIGIFAAIGILSYLHIKKKSDCERIKTINLFINIAFGMYILDFFLMPFAYGEIDIEKLPFHVCTAMCVMCFLSRHNKFFGKFKLQFAMLGFLSNLIYLIYPAGVMWHAVHPLSYRVIQTLSFHGVMMLYGALALIYESKDFCWKNCYKDFLVIAAMTAWAWVGNTLYNSKELMYNWFFVVRDPFNMLPESIAPYIMPFLNTIVFFSAEILIYFILLRLPKVFKAENKTL